MAEIDGQMMFFDVAEMDRDTAEKKHAAFVQKFKPKLTTDDCYTPPLVMEAVAGWVAEHYNLAPETFVRPFYPGGDYEHFEYPEGCTVVDNPPFSILAQIVRFYVAHGIRFFLFAPTLTLFGVLRDDNRGRVCASPNGVAITYDNGAEVNTSFVTNLETLAVHTFPDLYKRVEAANEISKAAQTRTLPKYTYPDELITAANAYRLCKYGQEIRIAWDDCCRISGLDAQKEAGKAVFGGGLLLSERAAAERAAAERAAAERAAATRWPLSERERRIVSGLGKR